jgi:hypothetical protein
MTPIRIDGDGRFSADGDGNPAKNAGVDGPESKSVSTGDLSGPTPTTYLPIELIM